MSFNEPEDKQKQPVGAVLVVGAGIGGMQASLDLAEVGLKVFLLERGPAIGGTMAQLDKTFPTNDCSMCIMSPKLVEVGRHLNIEILTTADIEGISGEPGDFRVKIRQEPRYVNLAACTGCGDCAAACPVSRPDEFNRGLSERHAIYKAYPQAIPNAFAIEKRGVSPCRNACPINPRALGYLARGREGRFADAYRTIKEDNPFPSICGRVCNHRCEDECTRNEGSTPVNIMGLKRFVADWWWRPENPGRKPFEAGPRPASGKKVAVVGAGPAGLTCALDLVRKGHAVKVFEALPAAGGMMRVGIPEYRLPPDVVQREVDDILTEGVELALNTRVDDVPGLLKQGFEAVFVATGAHQGSRLPIPGADLPQVTQATDFLRTVSLRKPGETGVAERVSGKRVLVLGGGNVAIDAAMTSVRLGAAWVGMACLESRAKMPAHDWEVRDAEEEGIEVFASRTFKEITRQDGAVAGVRCVQVDLHGFVEGRPDFTEVPGTEEVIQADTVIFAIGQAPQLGSLKEQVETVRGRFLKVDPDSLATSLSGIFAGGDVVTGTTFVVDAIAAGHKAAESIDRYLNGLELSSEHPRPALAEIDEGEARQRMLANPALAAARHEMQKRPANQRRQDFEEVYLNLSEEEARAEAARCLGCGICSECLQCVYVCRANAIDHNMPARELELNVGAIILSPGSQPLPGEIKPEFGYGRYPNVVTSLEFERMLSASGPFGGVIQRPSDGHHPVRVAWIQCVGSRDPRCEQGYCSSVCCMYATKEAVMAREHDPRIQPSIFYMDLRSFGKGFDAYIERAEKEQGVLYVRCMVSTVKEIPGNRNLRLSYATFNPDGRPVSHEDEFDLVVLSTGLKPSEEAQAAARRLGVTLNEFGFAEAPDFYPSTTSRPGIYVAGAFAEPKDIPETVIEASCAAAHASADLAEGRGTLTRQMVYPPERDVSQEEPRVGVFVCHCGINIGGVVNVPEVVEFAKGLPNVVYAERNLYTCSQDTQEKITKVVREQGLNRVVVASCTPRTHEPLFQDTIRQAGLNPYLFELANLREQDAWVHRGSPEAATHKAMQLVAMAVAKAKRLRPLQRGTLNVEPSALVIGGGLGGMTASLAIAAQGFAVTLVERQAQLGGNLRHIYTGIGKAGIAGKDGSGDPQALLLETIRRVSEETRISVLLESQVKEVTGYVGQFHTSIADRQGGVREVSHGAIVVATGGQEIRPTAYAYGQLDGVMTQREFEGQILSDFRPDPGKTPQSVVMVQCVGSRDEQHPYCSRICCTQAIKNALQIKQLNPSSSVTILYRDLRSYGFRERLYRQARQAGVLFLQYDAENKPVVSQGAHGLEVKVTVQPENETLSLPAERVVLSAGIEAEPGNAALSQQLKLPLTAEGFFLEAHVKLRPVDFAADGVFLCGLAHSPRSMDETIAQAQAAAVRAAGLLAKKELTATPIIASVNPRLCAACGICVEVCPYGARRLEPGMQYAEVIDVLCQGCGACVAACPNKASQQRGFEFLQINAMIDAAMENIG
jgi:heterodisulfide reductase subunit A-like polyferredoxin